MTHADQSAAVELLRKAAASLRVLADGFAAESFWQQDIARVENQISRAGARWARLMGPRIGPMLAAILDAEADCLEGVQTVQDTIPRLLDSVGDGPSETTMTVTIDSSKPALEFARLVLAASHDRDDHALLSDFLACLICNPPLSDTDPKGHQ